jgi:hypothetical protein
MICIFGLSEILEAVPFVVDVALTACAHPWLFSRDGYLGVDSGHLRISDPTHVGVDVILHPQVAPAPDPQRWVQSRV